MRARITMTVIALVGVGIYFLWTKYLRSPDVWVTLDNAGDAPLSITLNGKDMGSIAPHTHKRLENVKPGKYQLVAKNAQGAIIEQADYTVEPTSRGGADTCYVYNLTGTGKYVFYTANYSLSRTIQDQVDLVGENQKFFQVSKTNCILDDSMKKEVTLPRGQTHKAIYYICHLLDDNGNVGCKTKD